MRNIIIYRHLLFGAHEGYVFQQTKYLGQYRPIFTGRRIMGPAPVSSTEIRAIRPLGFSHILLHTLFRDTRAFQQLLSQDEPALIHSHCGVDSVYALPLAKKFKIPLITTFHGFDATFHRRALLRTPSCVNYLAFRPQLAKKGDLFIAVSDFIYERLVRLGFPQDRLVQHYIGVDTDEIKPSLAKKPEKIILHVALLVKQKGTEYLLKAFSILRKKGWEARLIIIGDGPLKQKLIHLAESLEIMPFVTFLGTMPHPEVIQWMQKASVFCLPSIIDETGSTEALGMVLLEASACQVPSVASQHGGIPEVIKNGETGFLVPQKDPYALAERIVTILENETLGNKMGLAARQFVQQKFNLKLQTQKLENLYNSIIG